MAQARKQRPSRNPSSFERARAKANVLLDIAFAQEPSKFETVRLGRRTQRSDDVRAELHAARARVEALFAQPRMEAGAILQRINQNLQDGEEQQLFTMMAGPHR